MGASHLAGGECLVRLISTSMKGWRQRVALHLLEPRRVFHNYVKKLQIIKNGVIIIDMKTFFIGKL